uniref:Uncharacterized protein n=1 Tax=Romanomermis culicivorax TaxID=13658 RepID=A0A915JYK2_ROMCU
MNGYSQLELVKDTSAYPNFIHGSWQLSMQYGKARFGAAISALHFGAAVWAPTISALGHLGAGAVAGCFGAKLFVTDVRNDMNTSLIKATFVEAAKYFNVSVILLPLFHSSNALSVYVVTTLCQFFTTENAIDDVVIYDVMILSRADS